MIILTIKMFIFSIWDHLVDITKGGRTTVIITTHYIDETKQADIVSSICFIKFKMVAGLQLDRVRSVYCLLSFGVLN